MSLKPICNLEIPSLTRKIALASFPKGNTYMKLRDSLGNIFDDNLFEELYPKVGQPTVSPWRLALITILQHGENLSDRQAVDAVRSRIDWKYLLSLDIDDSGFDFSVLSEFRKRLIENNAQELIFNKILDKCKELKLIKSRGKQRTDSTHVIANIRTMNRTEIIDESFRATLNELAILEPDWLTLIAKSDWYDKYSSRVENYRLPKSVEDKEIYTLNIGHDIKFLFDQIEKDNKNNLLKLDKVSTLKVTFDRFFKQDNDQNISLRSKKEILKLKDKIESPYDTEARFRTKRDSNWIGYAVHLTETCDDKSVNLITNIHTTPADVHDSKVTESIHNNLKSKNLVPNEHIVDTGYMSIDNIIHAKKYFDISMVGKMKIAATWQDKADGAYKQKDFEIDWDNKVAKCPQGKYSSNWKENDIHRIHTSFRIRDCRDCPAKKLCTKGQSRKLNILVKEYNEVKNEYLSKLESENFKNTYKKRSGIEGTISQAVRKTNIRKCRYIGLSKTSLQEIFKASAINFFRLVDWFNEKAISSTRESRFYRLKPVEI